MAFTVTCPKCNTALHAPDGVAGRRVICKRCGEVFVADDSAGRSVATPPALPPIQERRPDDEIREDREARYRDDEDSRVSGRRLRRRPRRRKTPSGRTLLFIFLGVSGLLLCCGGGVGIGIYSMYAEGKPTDYQSEEGTFTAAFPGTPERVELEPPRPSNGNAGKIDYVVETWGTTYEVTVRGLDSRQIPADGLNEQNAELLLDVVADGFNQEGTMQVIRKAAVTHQGRRGIELEIKNSAPDYATIRMFLVNRKLYVIWVLAADRPPDRKKAANFLNSLRIHEIDPPADNRK